MNSTRSWAEQGGTAANAATRALAQQVSRAAGGCTVLAPCAAAADEADREPEREDEIILQLRSGRPSEHTWPIVRTEIVQVVLQARPNRERWSGPQANAHTH